MNKALEIKGLKKIYDNFTLGALDLTIPSGTIVGLIGENGAGKTTLIKAILNIIKPNEGSIKIFQKDNLDYEAEIKEEIGIVLDNSFFPEILSPKNINTIMANVYKNWDKQLFYKYLSGFKIKDTQNLKTMSKGMRKKLEIATALAHHPKLLILDEPTSGLDPVVRSEVIDIFMDFIHDEEHSILLSTHITSDLESIADRIVFIDKGQKILDETHEKIFDNYGILKCDTDKFKEIDKKDIVAFKKNKYNYEVLIDNIREVKKKYKDFVIDNINLEELMVIMIKGEKMK